MSSSSSRLGLRAGELLLAGVARPRRIGPICTTRLTLAHSFTTSQSRSRSGLSRAAIENATPRTSTQMSPKTEIAQRLQKNRDEVTSEALAVILPGTLVLPPLSEFPKSLGQKLRFLGYWVILKGQEMLTNAALKFSSKPTFFKRALFKPNRSTVILNAKALHRSMAEALATGDKDTINRVCTRKLATSLLASIDARPRGRRYEWELVGYTNRLFYPSLKSHKMSPMSRERNAPIVRQAIVAISSRQRRVAYDWQGQVVPGSEREIDVVENVAIACIVDGKTWKEGEWRLIGTVKPTTLEQWMEEKELLKAMLQQS